MAKELQFVMLLDCYGDLLTQHQRNVMELYYCEDLSLAEIGQPLGITPFRGWPALSNCVRP